MYATLYTFLRLSPADRAKVTHLDLSIVDEQDLYREPAIHLSFDGLGVGSRGDSEEYSGEGRDRGTDQRGFNK